MLVEQQRHVAVLCCVFVVVPSPEPTPTRSETGLYDTRY